MIGIDIIDIRRFHNYKNSELLNILSKRILGNITLPKNNFADEISIARIFAIKEAIIKASSGRIPFGDISLIGFDNAENSVFHATYECKNEKLNFKVSSCTSGDYVLAIAILES
jgi:phosphopantetheine--protein transferase-like protein